MTPARILIVEDEHIVAEDIAQLLVEMGYHVAAIVDSGEAAINFIHEDPPDLILMDIHLSGKLTGIEAAGTIRQTHDVPIIYLTAFTDADLVEKAKTTIPSAYIVKPYNGREIRSAIEIALYTHALQTRLRESEEKFRGFLENFVGIAYQRRSDLRFEFLHGAVEAITGYTADELLGGTPSWDEIVYPTDKDSIQIQNANVGRMAGVPIKRDYRIVTKNGTIKWVHEIFHVVPGRRDALPSLQGAIYDISDLKAAEESLRTMNAELEKKVRARTFSLDHQVRFLEQLIDAIPSPLYYKDLSGSYMGCNTAFEKYLGVPRSHIVGRTDAEIFSPEIAAFMRERDSFLLEHQGLQVYQTKFLHADRTIRDVLVRKTTFTDTRGNIAGIIGVIIDISERIRAEETLRESEQRFRAVVQDQTDLIWRFLPDWTVIFANSAFLDFFGKTREDTLGYIFRLPFSTDDQGLFEKHLGALSEKNPVGTVEVRLMGRDEDPLWVQWSTRAFFDSRGTVREYLSVGRDITEKKKLEEVQQAVLRQMERIFLENMTLCHTVRDAVLSIADLSGECRNNEKISQKCREILAILDKVSENREWQKQDDENPKKKKYFSYPCKPGE